MRIFVLISLGACLLTSCAPLPKSAGEQKPFNPLPDRSLTSGYMPEWTASRFDEAEATNSGIMSRPYQLAVVAARKLDEKSLEDVLACSYSRYCDGAAGEIHSGVLQQLLLAWGDVKFSQALARVKARHGGKFPDHAFGIMEPDFRRFFPLTARAFYGH